MKNKSLLPFPSALLKQLPLALPVLSTVLYMAFLFLETRVAMTTQCIFLLNIAAVAGNSCPSGCKGCVFAL